ncbi:phosphoglucomutase [Puniceicoccus vermicola]|uniref:Phospho-sugar mutase n=2 Tax=Puniceicoccus vermicola TaxID=388746 RepID=A0A7X1E4C8_9BACT|nr:phospho-sugar mutase [Puniceicoccus vermicola]MBC2600472.1 phospho-sugar mutase [Puniceicoccus vermicola]
MPNNTAIKEAVDAGKLLAASAENLNTWLQSPSLPQWAIDSLNELVEQEQWEELNDRFFQNMAFGTGGMRGRTIGSVATSQELGAGGPDNPDHAAIGANVLNDINVTRATMGLFRYTKGFLAADGRDYEVPKLVIAHDVRFFSRHFCELASSVWNQMGGQAYIFDGPRSTPQLSFSVRFLGAHTGIVITASHNPSHDNGYKVYFEDGAQTVSPHAEGIVGEVDKVSLDETAEFLEKDLSRVVTLGESADSAYLDVLEGSVLDRDLLSRNQPKVVFTAIHGTGRVSSIPLLKRLGLEVSEVPEQAIADSRFPTVKSPNPENAEALSMAIAQAKEEGSDLVVATDPDADRMAVAVRREDGEMVLLTGNMIGSILAEFRIRQMKKNGLLPEEGTQSATLIKTFVTTPLQERIGHGHGLKVINTLTGFKWIGAKLRQYQETLDQKLRETQGIVLSYDDTDYQTRARLLLEHSTFYVFGGEESYGYLANDLIRDKDANAAVLMFCELMASLKEEGKTVLEFLDEIYLKHGYHLERLGNVYYEGASGAAKIANILKSYRENPPKEMNGVAVEKFTDFGTQTIHDADGDVIPSQDFYFVSLANGHSYAVRGSGTEPKIKFYVFGRQEVASEEELPKVKESLEADLKALREAIEADAAERAG